MEKYYTFIKNNRVANVAVFAAENQELANKIVQEQNYDVAIWTDTFKPELWSTFNGETFTVPTEEYLISIGIITPVEETNDEG